MDLENLVLMTTATRCHTGARRPLLTPPSPDRSWLPRDENDLFDPFMQQPAKAFF